jgi:oligopeptide/dipeptide ABC transporter, ATP-binding protein, C-terminal domain
MSDRILEVCDLKISFRTDEGLASVLDHVELRVPRGHIVGVVGESGCGKSTLLRAILGILPVTATVERGEIIFDGEDLLSLDHRTMSRRIRGKAIGFIPQDPFLALNPVFRIGTQLFEIMRWHASAEGGEDSAETADGLSISRRLLTRSVRKSHRQRLLEVLRAVQIPDPETALERYPHQFSGGQRQRLLIAAALACRPRMLLADEPTTALDVTTQLQILKLLKRLVNEFGLSMLFVTHDFGVVAQLCDEASVMYAGQSVESGTTTAILNAARHPYTQALIDCHPDRSSAQRGIPGMVPSPLAPPSGCRFHPRCPSALPVCQAGRPVRSVDETGHTVWCVLYNGNQPQQANTLG